MAAAFQKDPQVLIGHPGVVNKLDDLKGKTILISAAANTTYWPWLKATYGLEDSQVRPYTFNIQPFVADKNVVQQGYLSSEPYAIEKEANFKPNVFLLADHGWPPYATTISVHREGRAGAAQGGGRVRQGQHGGLEELPQGRPGAGQCADQEGQSQHDRRQAGGRHPS